MDRNIRPVGEAYQQIIAQWSTILNDNWTKNQYKRRQPKQIERVLA
jgi:hypothetical protein